MKSRLYLLVMLLGTGVVSWALPPSLFDVPPEGLGVKATRRIASADLNHDGILDLILSSNQQPGVQVLLGKGDGSFNEPTVYLLVQPTFDIVTADANGDGQSDLFLLETSQVELLLGNGDGTFRSGPVTKFSQGTSKIVAYDFNHDGITDLAWVARKLVGVSFGRGDGTFGDQVTYPIGTDAHWLVAGDFSGDGSLDLVASNQQSISILAGNGDGTFKPAQSFAAATTNVYSLAVGDFNEDGHLDIAGAGDNGLSVWLGKGDGTFGAAKLWPGGTSPRTLSVGDMNGDGHADIVLMDGGAASVAVLLGLGTGDFPTVSYYQILSSAAITLGDFDRNGTLDVAGAGDLACVLFGKGDGSLIEPRTFSLGSGVVPTRSLAMDFNRDGRSDVVTANPSTDSLSVVLGTSSGFSSSFQISRPPQSYPSALASADFNRDGVPDLLVMNHGLATASVLLGKGDGTFGQDIDFPTDLMAASFATGDINGDGKPDVAVWTNGAISLSFGHGDGTFGGTRVITAGPNIDFIQVAFADWDGDGKSDLIVLEATYDQFGGRPFLAISLGNGDGTFQFAAVFPMRARYAGTYGGLLADFNGDGRLDFVLDTDGDLLVLYLSNNEGSLQPGIEIARGAVELQAADVDGDGKLDLVTREGSGMSVRLGNGDGTFHGAQSYGDGFGAQTLAVGDFSGSGKPDVAVGGSGGLTLLTNVIP